MSRHGCCSLVYWPDDLVSIMANDTFNALAHSLRRGPDDFRSPASPVATGSARRDRFERQRVLGELSIRDEVGGSLAIRAGGDDTHRRRVETERFDADVRSAGS